MSNGQATIYKRFEQHKPHKKTGSELKCSGRVGSSCAIRRAILVAKPVIYHEMRKGPGISYDKLNISVFFVKQKFHNG